MLTPRASDRDGRLALALPEIARADDVDEADQLIEELGGARLGGIGTIGKKQLQLCRKAHDGLTGFVMGDHHVIQLFVFDLLVHGLPFQLVTAACLATIWSDSGPAVPMGPEMMRATNPTGNPPAYWA